MSHYFQFGCCGRFVSRIWKVFVVVLCRC